MKRFDIREWLLAFWAKCKVLPWARIGLITLCSVLALILIALIFVTAYTEHLLGQITDLTDPTGSVTDISTGHTAPSVPSDVTIHINPTLPSEPQTVIAHEDIVNIMLVGQDRRPGTTGRTLSDVMILCTLNKKDNTITLTSFMRDIYLSIPDHGFGKMNAAYAGTGGTKRLSNTLLKNFGVQVDAFVEVDFQAFRKIVDILGGVDIYLTAAEANYMNTVWLDNVDYGNWNLKPGMNRLTSNQALYYSRIRKIDDDYNRTQRQRNVINAIIKGCKNMSLSQILSLMNQVLPYIGTDMTNSEIIGYATELFPLLANGTVVSQRIPIDGSFQDDGNNIYIDLDMNHQFLVDTLLPD